MVGISQTAQLAINIDQMHLLSVTDALDAVGLIQRQIELALLLDGSWFVAIDLSPVSHRGQDVVDLLIGERSCGGKTDVR